MPRPRIPDDPLYLLLREGKIEEFNRRWAAGEQCDLSGVDLSRVDLRKLEAAGLDLGDSYLRMADLRGLDLRQTNLEGASIAAANISGCYFPPELTPEEILLSIQHGTRMRYRSP